MSHEFYLAMSYGVTALALAIEIALLRMRRARAAPCRGREGT